jgi:hypothetical protein
MDAALPAAAVATILSHLDVRSLLLAAAAASAPRTCSPFSPRTVRGGQDLGRCTPGAVNIAAVEEAGAREQDSWLGARIVGCYSAAASSGARSAASWPSHAKCLMECE